jgi:glycosyltransferase involved in cell wall biosynthesis
MADAIRRFVLSRAAVVIANSWFTANSLSADPALDGIVTIHNPVDLARFDPQRIGREAARARLGLPAEAEVIGVVAQITPWKAQDDAIRVLHLLRKARPSLHLLIVGGVKFAGGARYDNEGYLRFLLRLVNELNVGSAATFLGDREDVPEILAALDVVLVPSWEEPFGRSMVEAMAMGVPVVATSVGGPPEVITNGDDGVLLAPRQPAAWAATVDHLLARPGLCATMGHRARQTAVTRFSLAAHATRVTALYRMLVAAEPPGTESADTA